MNIVVTKVTRDATLRPYLTGTVLTLYNRSSTTSLISIIISLPTKPQKSMAVNRQSGATVKTYHVPRCGFPASAAEPDVKGDRAIKDAQTTFLSQVMGFKCFVYQKVNIRPMTTESLAGTPGTAVRQSKSVA